MADKTAIEWTDATWNPTVGCSIVSKGCTNCYAMKMAARLEAMGQPIYRGLTQPSKAGPVWTGKVALSNWGQVIKPLSWRRPRRIFVNSMSDLFHESLPDGAIDQVFAVMALCPQHTFQVLTKRPVRMRDYLGRDDRAGDIRSEINDQGPGLGLTDQRIVSACHAISQGPLPNVWLGVSVEDQDTADARIPVLLDTPAAKRFVSAEPLLGPVRLDRIEEYVDWFKDCGGHPDPAWPPDTGDAGWLDALRGCRDAEARAPDGTRRGAVDVGLRHRGGNIDWVIAGGESGPGARPAHPDWFRSLRDQCAAAGVPFFFKQHGEWSPVWRDGHICSEGDGRARGARLEDDGWKFFPAGALHGDTFRIGKRAAGALLDGREHREFPR